MCSLAHPLDCTSREFTTICGPDALADPDLSAAELASLRNNCLFSCNYLVHHFDYCSFEECKDLGHKDYQWCK